MSSGLPTLLSDIPVSREIAGKSAIYFSAKSAEDLASKIMELIQNPVLLKDIKISASKLALEYSWSKTFLKTVEVYEKILHSMWNFI